MTLSPHLFACLFVSLLTLLTGCATEIKLAPIDPVVKQARDAQTLDKIRALGRDGDWLVIRAYHATDNAVAFFTNTPWSHAAVLNLTGDSVVEAESQGVHASTLSDFVKKSHRLMLIRPMWSNAQTAQKALSKAKELVGRPYDFLGLIGLNVPDRFYCSELALAVYAQAIPQHMAIPRPVQPGQLHFWGQVLYDAGAIDTKY